MVASKWTLGDIPGIFRPAIAVPIPSEKGECVMLDAGSSTDCSPENLFQFAVMGHHYARRVLKIEKPGIALLNIGSEKSKGNLEVQKAYEFLSSSEMNFIGNIEGDELFSGKADVIICDGFVGNIVLKVTECTARKMMNAIKSGVEKGGITERLGIMLLNRIFRTMRKQMDWMEYGGAVIMGVEGNVIITHGKSNASSISNAISFATRVAKANLAGIISEEIRNSMMRSSPITGFSNNSGGS
jgi:glycerol-3-phosphate acyltransferase PlsX